MLFRSHGRWADRTVPESCAFSALRTIAGTVLRTNASHIADVKRTEHTQQPNGLQDNYENHSSKEDQTVVVSLLVVDPAMHFECAWPEVCSHRVNQFAKDLRKQLPKVLPCAWYFSLLLPLAISSISRCEVRTLHMLGNVQDCPLLRRTRHGKKKMCKCVCVSSFRQRVIYSIANITQYGLQCVHYFSFMSAKQFETFSNIRNFDLRSRTRSARNSENSCDTFQQCPY